MRDIAVGAIIGGAALTIMIFSFVYPKQAKTERELRAEIASNYLTIHDDCKAAKHWDSSVECQQN